jgi:hypothetical protein
MPISPGTTTLQVSGDRIAPSEFAYFAARNRRKIYSVIMKEFKKSKLSQAQLARRMGQRTDVICRWLAGPGNYTLDTVSNLLLGISNGEMAYSVANPFSAPAKKFSLPDWAVNRANADGNRAPPPSSIVEGNKNDSIDPLLLEARR